MYEHKNTVGGGMTEMEKRKQEKMAELKEKRDKMVEEANAKEKE